MAKKLVIIKIEQRNKEATEAQKILTEFGCIIKTRLGLHDTDNNSCSSEGLIILELVGSKDEEKKMISKLSQLKSVVTKEVEI
ncbi:MAG: hypothetical protein A2015_16475 [Spirochaetes bacterium GWF1_31_7]|nr:MAG: hypothetical protein A2Y30_13840 [Spirochaetes bacterium GWE1_32_154]OHD50041.1 MAG: hypothetical protein A2Y29_11885 [Spirochaetes bacterium GWE2_31_10]OHD52355.1 MAG: hypothetical protein A2015_16475 [Spirochaetes bacterium GWF1_31_7]OHD83161.1 MAG: hypothetical protein A2355_09990 [Spirochaetes bacterium RIFOXYB1_FULL_32_8]HBD95994.1 hypothetical protein [Spirochaetia bacterium]